MFIHEWQEFLKNLGDLCRHRLKEPDRQHYEGLNAPLRKVINDLQGSEAEAAVSFAIATAHRNTDDSELLGLVEDEMKFFNSLMTSSRDPQDRLTIDKEQATTALAAGKTIKDSIEKLFELPRWLKRLLDILNELLSIIRGGN
jgi:hypothetical protein